ncbi:MAG: nucleotidyltransferase family protein [Candidatus Omnitrophota bacterium]
MVILILAAGYATRLYPLTIDKPKPLLPVGDRTILGHIVKKISELTEVRDCFIITNQKFFSHFSAWAEKADLAIPLGVINDETTTNENRLGAIKDIEFALKAKGVDDDILVIGGDNLFEFSLKDFVGFARSKSPHASLALFDINDREKAKLYGVARVDAQGQVVSFEEKPPAPQSTLIATCVYYFPREAVRSITTFIASGNKADAPGNYIKWLSEHGRVYGYNFKEPWFDIGDIASYEEANRIYKKKA